MELSLPEMENADYAGLMIRGGKENLIWDMLSLRYLTHPSKDIKYVARYEL
jgi:hypothetical protein